MIRKWCNFSKNQSWRCFIAQKTQKKHEKKFPDELRKLFLRMKKRKARLEHKKHKKVEIKSRVGCGMYYDVMSLSYDVTSY